MAKKGAFDTFSSEDVLRGDTWKGRKLTQEELSLLKTQASEFKESVLWKVLSSDIQWFAAQSLLLKGGASGQGDLEIRIAQTFFNIVQEINKRLNDLAK